MRLMRHGVHGIIERPRADIMMAGEPRPQLFSACWTSCRDLHQIFVLTHGPSLADANKIMSREVLHAHRDSSCASRLFGAWRLL
jgi:hypothetical protein